MSSDMSEAVRVMRATYNGVSTEPPAVYDDWAATNTVQNSAPRNVDAGVPVSTRGDVGAELLDRVSEILGRYVAFPNEASLHAVALWIVHAHAVSAFESTPRLVLLSAEKGSGKTRTVEVMALLVPRPIHAVNISAAALFRLISKGTVTLLLDECDTYLGLHVSKQHEDLRGLINAGHRRGATVYRGEVVGKTVNVSEWPAFAPCALAGIGDIPDTILDRSVAVEMKRRAPHEHVQPFRERLVRDEATELREQIAAWADEHLGSLEAAWPEMPEGIVDRAADVWEPLLAVADAAGGDWPQKAREAAVTLNNARAERDPSRGVQLLRDCRRVFTEQNVDRLTSKALVEALVQLDEAPWGDLRGKQLDKNGLAARLRPYGVRPAHHRFDEKTLRGYLAEDFYDAWQRYLPSDQDAVAAVTAVTGVSYERGREGDDNGLVTPREEKSTGSKRPIPEKASLSASRGAQHPQHPQQQTLGCYTLLLGDPGYPLQADRALTSGHITAGELERLLRLDRIVRAATEPSAVTKGDVISHVP